MVLLTGTVAAAGRRRGGRAAGPGLRRRRHAGDQPPAHRDAAAGDAAGHDRRGEPLAGPRDRRQPVDPRPDRRLPVRHRPRQSGTITDMSRLDATGCRRLGTATGSTTSTARPPRAAPAGCSGSTCSSTLDLGENNGLVTTLAEPTLTALSGETASFLAGGEFPIPISQSLGAVTIEYKQYGVGLAFTPDRARGRPHLDAGPPGSVRAVDRRRDPPQQLRGPGADHAARRDDGRARLRPELHDRRPAAQHRQQLDRPGALPRQSADHRRAVPLDTVSAAARPSW